MNGLTLLRGDLEAQSFAGLEDAICADTPTMVFYPERGEPIGPTREAVARCVAECVVRTECLQYALDNRELGWWGGVSERGRRALRRSGLTVSAWLETPDGQRYSHPQWGRPQNRIEDL